MRRLTRKEFLRLSAAPLGAALSSAAAGTAETGAVDADPSPRSSNRPNVLILMTDQHRADLMTCAGRGLVPTPNIDRIASRGVRFANAYCPYPVCVASRMARRGRA